MTINQPYTNLYFIHINPNHPFNLSDNPMDIVERMGGDVGQNIQSLKTLDSWFNIGLRILREFPEKIPGTHLIGALQYIAEFHNRIFPSKNITHLRELRIENPQPETTWNTEYFRKHLRETTKLRQLQELAAHPENLEPSEKIAIISEIALTQQILDNLKTTEKLAREIRDLGLNYAQLRFLGYTTETLKSIGFIRP